MKDEKKQALSVPRKALLLLGIACFAVFALPLAVSALNLGGAAGMALGLALICWALWKEEIIRMISLVWQHKGGKTLLFIFTALIGAVALVFLTALTAVFGGMFSRQSTADTIVVLGCMVRDDGPSLSLRYRIDSAYECLMENPNAVCIATGGMGEGECRTEASCIAEELQKMGVPAERILLEEQSTSTYENLLYARDLIDINGLSRQVTVVSSNFHVFRGCLVARELGLDASGRGAKTVWYLFPTYVVREACAVVHYRIFGY